MPEEIVAKDRWGQIVFYDEWNSLGLKWLSSTAEASDPDVKMTMETFAQEAVNRHPYTLIVDTTEFRHKWGEGMLQWRDAEIVPLYNKAGVTKFAFIVSPDYPVQTVEDGATPALDGPANFPTGWFKTREGAYRWLAG